MIKIFQTKEQFNTYTNNGQNIPSGFLYYVKEDETVHFNTNNIDGTQEIKDGLTDPEGEGYIIPDGNISITENGTDIDVKQYETASVAVPLPTGNITLTQNGENIDIEDYATATVNVPVPQGYIIPTGDVSITANGTNIDVAQYATASVNVPSGMADLTDLIERDITSIDIPSGVTSIGDSAFRGCSGLTSVSIPSSVTSIGGSAFRGCSGLTSVNIPNSVTSIGSGAFSNCSGLTSVSIGNGVTSIGDSAFENPNPPYNTFSLYIYATTPPTLGNNVFRVYINPFKIYVPAESVEAYKAASGWSTQASYIEAIPTT